jgi:hypothetical protein
MRMQGYELYDVHLFVNLVTANSLSQPTRISRPDCNGILKEFCTYQRVSSVIDCGLDDLIVIRGWLRILCLSLMQPHKCEVRLGTRHEFPEGE